MRSLGCLYKVAQSEKILTVHVMLCSCCNILRATHLEVISCRIQKSQSSQQKYQVIHISFVSLLFYYVYAYGCRQMYAGDCLLTKLVQTFKEELKSCCSCCSLFTRTCSISMYSIFVGPKGS